MQFDQLKRREFITLLGSAAAAWPLAARAQQEGAVARVGVIGPSRDSPASSVAYPVFIDELRKLGFAEGRNLAVEYRRVDQGVPSAFAGVNELIVWKADVLFAFGPELALQAAAAARPLADRGSGAAGREAADHRRPGHRHGYRLEPMDHRFCAAAARTRLDRGPHGRD